MLEAMSSILLGLLSMVVVGAGIVGYVIWRSNRRMDDAAAAMAKEAGES